MNSQTTPIEPESICVAIDAGLWFSYGRDRRESVTVKTTFDAVLVGQRTSTTRFRVWPGHSSWKKLCVGDHVRFHASKDRTGRSLIVRVDSIQPLNLFACTPDQLEEWSLCEGWSVEKGRALGKELGEALWIKHTLVWPALTKAPTAQPVQGSLF